jgi:hypothetical protein
MPKCKNGHGTYKGTEPSPKGLGYCAKHEKVHSKKFGLNGYLWIVKQTKTSKRWFPIKQTKSKPNKTKQKTKRKNKSMITPLTPLSKIQKNGKILEIGTKLQINIRMPLEYYIDDGETLHEAPKTTKLTNTRILKYLKSKDFKERVEFTLNRLPITKGTLWWVHNIIPRFTPKLLNMTIRVDSHRIFYITINTILTNNPPKDLDPIDRIHEFTFQEYQKAIQHGFMHWHSGDILQFKKPHESIIQFDSLDLYFKESDISIFIA